MNRSQVNSRRTESFSVRNNLCFTCSNNTVPVEVTTTMLKRQGLINLTEEKQTILQVTCQLLRVQWKSVAEVMTLDDGKSNFCTTCFKIMTNVILLRKKIFQIETEIRNELKSIEKSVAMTWTESGHTLDESEQFPGKSQDVRTIFQRQAMQEILSKELLQQKVTQLHQTSNKVSFDLKPSMVQLHLTKNMFEIDAVSKKEELMDMTSSTVRKVDLDYDDTDDNWTPSYRSVASVRSYPKFTLRAMLPSLVDSNSEVCPRKKAKNLDVTTTLNTVANQDVTEQPSFISSSSEPIREKSSESFDSLEHFLVLVESTTSVETSMEESSILKPKSPKTPIKKQDGKLTTALSTQNVKKKNDTKLTPKSKKSRITSNLMTTEPLEFAAETETKKDLIASDETIFDGLEVSSDSDDSEESTEEVETFLDSDIENDDKLEIDSDIEKDDKLEIDFDIEKDDKLEKTDEEKSEPMSSISLDSTSCSTQLFKPKFSRTSKPKKEQTSIKLEQPEGIFLAKDQSTWTTKEPKDSQVVRDYEVLQQNGGLIGPAQNTQLTPVELFKLMFPLSIVEKIVNYTNKHAKVVESQRAESWQPMTVDEMYAYIGIVLFLGVEKKRLIGIKELWTTDEKYSIPSIVATICSGRFAKIQSHLRFDDTQARKSGPITEKIDRSDTKLKRSYISELLDPFVEVMQSHLSPYDTLVLDEMLVKFRGHLELDRTSKREKHGMKFCVVCDVETGYLLNISLHHGQIGDTKVKKVGNTVVLDLVKKYFNSGRAVTMDNVFTSKALGEELIKHKMSMLGKLKEKRMDAIPEFNDLKGREVESSVFAFQGNFTMVSYIKKKNPATILLSTRHHSAEICPGMKKKPRMILDFNATKGGVQTANQKIANYSCQRSTNRWPVKVFYALLDIAAFNAYAVHQHHASFDKKVVMDRRLFLRSICEKLMEPLILIRLQTYSASNFSLPEPLYKAMLRMGYENQIKIPKSDRTPPGKNKCSKCKKATPAKKTPAKATTAKTTTAKATPPKATTTKVITAKTTTIKTATAKATPPKATTAEATTAEETPPKKTAANGTAAKTTTAKATAAKATTAKATKIKTTPRKKTAAKGTAAKTTDKH